MSIDDSSISGTPAARLEDTIDIESLETLAGLVEDMANMAMSRTRVDLEDAVRQRLGANATLADAERIIDALRF